jgi:GntR family transcriptional regulator
MHTLMGLYEDVRILGGVVRSDVLRHAIAPASAELAGQLGIPANSPVMVLQKIGFADGKPLAFSTASLPEHLGKHTVDVDMTLQSLYLVSERNGIFGATGRRSVKLFSLTRFPPAIWKRNRAVRC